MQANRLARPITSALELITRLLIRRVDLEFYGSRTNNYSPRL